MGIFTEIFKALGFESESENNGNSRKKVKKVEPKASFNLKKDRIERPDRIDGVKVFYIENFEDCKKAIDLFKNDEPVLINFEYADDKLKALGFFEGAIFMSKGSMETIEENKLIILLPEGVEIE